MQKPNASHVMEYEKAKDSLYGQIIRSLDNALKTNESALYATYRLGASNIEFTKNRSNGLIGLRMGDKEMNVFKSFDEMKKIY